MRSSVRSKSGCWRGRSCAEGGLVDAAEGSAMVRLPLFSDGRVRLRGGGGGGGGFLFFSSLSGVGGVY